MGGKIIGCQLPVFTGQVLRIILVYYSLNGLLFFTGEGRRGVEKLGGGMTTAFDVFYRTHGMTLEQVREIVAWAHENALKTNVSMLNVRKSPAGDRSDKDFNEVFDLITDEASVIFRIILRKEKNLYAILTDDVVIDDIIEIGVRGIDVGPNEYLISILVDKKYMDELVERYGLEEML